MAGKLVVADNVEAFAPRVRMMESRRVRCAFRAGESTFYPYIDEVVRIQARRNYSEVFVTSGSFTVREVLVSLERRLAQFGFFRVQRSSLINLGHVVEIRREGRGRYAIVLSDGSSVTVPPSVRERVEQLLAGA
jgi:DNA-binding LytR/AlgR family response regulator